MPITTGQNAEASDFINQSERDATPSNDAGRVPKLESNGKLHPVFLSGFGGDGSDGALTVSSGTTTIDLGSAKYVTKNYTDISITGTGAINFSNPHANGTVIIFKVQGDVTITTSATRAIDMRGIGAAIGNTPTGVVFGLTLPTVTQYTEASAGSQYTSNAYYTDTLEQFYLERSLRLACGAAGANGGAGPSGTPGVGGRGGGVFLMEVGGTYNCSGTIDASGEDGTAGTTPDVDDEAPGGGGGGSAGAICILYNTLTSDTGTYTLAGGAGGASGAPRGPGGTGGAGGGGGGSVAADGGHGGWSTGAPQANGSPGGLGAGGGGASGMATSNEPARPGGAGGASLTAIVGQLN